MQAAVFSAGCGAALPSVLAGDEPVQAWFMQSYAQRMDYGLLFELETEERLVTEGRETLSRFEATPQIVWNHSPRYDFGAGYEFAQMWESDGMELQEHTGLAFFTVKLPVRDFRITSRQRFQFGAGVRGEETKEIAVFRHRLRVDWDTERLPFRLVPFLSNEWFLDLTDGEFRENRLVGGLMYRVNEALALEVFGMRLDEWNQEGEGKTSPVAGLAVNVEF
jgi:hypothetical protein